MAGSAIIIIITIIILYYLVYTYAMNPEVRRITLANGKNAAHIFPRYHIKMEAQDNKLSLQDNMYIQ